MIAAAKRVDAAVSRKYATNFTTDYTQYMYEQ